MALDLFSPGGAFEPTLTTPMAGMPSTEPLAMPGGGLSPETEQLSQMPPRPFADKPYWSAVYERLSTGILGTVIPPVAVSAAVGGAMGAGLASAPTAGLGAPLGAAVGALAGALADVLGSAGDVAVQRAIGPEGLQTPVGKLSPEVAGLLTNVGIGVLAGSAFTKGGVATATKLFGATPDAKYLAQNLPGILPTDPLHFVQSDPKIKAAARALAGAGVPYDWDSAAFNALPKAEQDKMVEILNRLATPVGNVIREDPSILNPNIVQATRRGGDMASDFIWKRLFSFLTPPWYMTAHDPAAARATQLMSSGEMLQYAVASKYASKRAEILKDLTPAEREKFKTIWLQHQGKSLEELRLDKPTEALPMFDEAPRMTAELSLTEERESMKHWLQRSGLNKAIGPWEQLSQTMEEQANIMVELGLLDPQRKIPNYLSFVRHKYAAERAQMVELPNGYFPVHLEKSIPAAARPYFTNRRTIDIPPKEMTLDNIFGVYDRVFSQAVVNSGIFPQMKTMLPMIQDPQLANYVGKMWNYYSGVPGTTAEHVGREWAGLVKNVEFLRTIGGSLLSPLVNSMQALNMLGYTSFKNWAKALLPNKVYDQRLTELGMVGSETLQQTRFLDSGSVMYGGLKNGMRNLNNFFGTPFRWSEDFVRKQAYRAGMYESVERGLPLDLAEKSALWMMDTTNFVTRVSRTPELMRGDLFSMLGQFKTYMINQAAYLNHIMRVNPTGAARLMVGALTLLGPDGVFPGMDLELGRRLFQRPEKGFLGFKGLLPHLGMAIGEQASITGFGQDDIARLAQFFPGPAVDHIQSALRAITGVDFGRGVDMSSFGRPVTPDDRASAFTRSLPIMGSEINRVRRVVKLLHSGNEDRASQTFMEGMGVTPSTGSLRNQMNRMEAMTSLLGIRPTRIGEQDQLMDEMQRVESEYKIYLSRISELYSTGHMNEAEELTNRFRRRFPEVAWFFPSLNSQKAAAESNVLPQAWRAVQHAPLPIRLPYMSQILSRG